MPDSARERDGLEELDALDLLHRVLDENEPDWDEDRVKAMIFICLACNAEMRPAAIRPGMKKAPYFRLQRGVRHKSGCDIYGYEELRNQRLDAPVSNESGFPVAYPSKLRLPISSETVDVESQPQREAEMQGAGNSHHHTVRTIKRLVTHFIDFPYPQDRCLPLDVPEVIGKTYAQVFERLSDDSEIRFDKFKIYFGELLYEQVNFEENRIFLPLVNRSNSDVMKFLEINIKDWSSARIGFLRNLVENCIRQIKKESRQTPPFAIWLFFLGQQDPKDIFKFRLFREDHRLIHCVVDNSLWREPQIICDVSEEPEILKNLDEYQDIEIIENTIQIEKNSDENTKNTELFVDDKNEEKIDIYSSFFIESDKELMSPVSEWRKSQLRESSMPLWKRLLRKIVKPYRQRKRLHRPKPNGWVSRSKKIISSVSTFIASGIKKLLHL